ncbi:MAG TPA: ABC transporter substrate-binding protein [Stellaceae bacterium]|nr:ABC transporter substrate-binding protein [Stellaceae bacterium]
MQAVLARFVLAVSALALASPALALDRITIGTVNSTGGASIFVAQALGYFAANGLDAKIVQFGAAHELSTAAAAGDIDFGSTGINAPLCVFANEGKIKIIGSGGEEHPGFHTVGFVVSNKAYDEGLHGLRDLGGHSIATTQFGGAFQYDIDLALKKYGIDAKTVRILGLQNNGNIASGIGGGQVDAAVQSSSGVYALSDSGKAKILGWVSDELGSQQTAFTFTTGAMAKDHPDIVKRFLDGFRKAGADWNRAFMDANGKRQDQPEAAKMIAVVATTLNLPPAAIAKAVGYFNPEAQVKLADLQNLLDWLYGQGMIKTKMDATSLLDSRFASIAP